MTFHYYIMPAKKREKNGSVAQMEKNYFTKRLNVRKRCYILSEQRKQGAQGTTSLKPHHFPSYKFFITRRIRP